MNGRLRLTAKNGTGPFISLQPPPGRTLTGTTQYETIDLFLESGEISNNTLLFYAGPAKVNYYNVLCLIIIYMYICTCALGCVHPQYIHTYMRAWVTI